jgi:hypothetical protein
MVVPSVVKIKIDRVSLNRCPWTELKTIELGWALRSSAIMIDACLFKIPKSARRVNNRIENFDLLYLNKSINTICLMLITININITNSYTKM